MNEQHVADNLTVLAEKDRRKAAELERSACGSGQPYFLRRRADEYEKARKDIPQQRPYPFEGILKPRPSQALALTSYLSLAGAIITLVILMLAQ